MASNPHAPFPLGGAWAGWSLARQDGIRATTPTAASAATRPHGLDVSSYQGNVNWTAVKNAGAKFVYIKATEGTYYTNPFFTQQYNGSYRHHIIRGAYHFANPSNSGGARQADYFVNHGGGWSADGRTLPGALDIEYNPYGSECYGKSQSGMAGWIAAFVNEYHKRTKAWPVIYSTRDWWTTCTGNSGAFTSRDPLWIASYNSTAGALPGGWPFYTFWQYADSGKFPGDQDLFNGSLTRLHVLAKQG
ncbi:MAG: lysozyme [Acidimicrobiaceae bacterium]|nr:lysozyme [Acidimicrobiaceae bacterium]